MTHVIPHYEKPPVHHAASLALVLLGLAGCTGNYTWRSEPVRVEQAFGSAVAQMAAAQTLNPDAATLQLDVSGTQRLNGEKARRTLAEYQKDVSKPKQVSNTINFNISSPRSR